MTAISPKDRMRDYLNALIIGLSLCILLWLIESFIHVYIFHEGSILSQLFPTDKDELWMRFLITIWLLLCSLSVTYFHRKTKLSNTSNLAYQILHGIGNAALITNGENKIIFINQRYTEITGYTWDEVVGKNPNVLSSGKQDKDFYKQLWDTLQLKSYWEGEIWNRKKDGELFPEWINISMVRDINEKPLYYIAIFSDISFKKEAEEKIIQYAYYDPLTNLSNRRFFNAQLRQAIVLSKRNREKLALLFIDLDDFKKISDKFGHTVGDKYLCKVANLMKAQLRESDIASRFGGDEFVLLLPNMQSKEAALELSKQLLFKLETAMIKIENNQLFIKASIGCAIYPDDGLEAESLIQYADERMYEVKAKRKQAPSINAM